MRKKYFYTSVKQINIMCKTYELNNLQIMLGEHMNLRIWSQLKAAQGSKAIWMILGWKGFMEEMS